MDRRLGPADRVVVGVVLVDGRGRVLAAERADGPGSLAGAVAPRHGPSLEPGPAPSPAPSRDSARWEFPGGKVEPGETEPDAAVRECQEELGVLVELTDAVPGVQPIGDTGWSLRLWTGRIVRGEPRPLVHARLRWVPAAELPALDWLPADRPFLPRIAQRIADLTSDRSFPAKTPPVQATPRGFSRENPRGCGQGERSWLPP